jgi:hypothetical protein
LDDDLNFKSVGQEERETFLGSGEASNWAIEEVVLVVR